jgi:hypothetical protein
MIARKKLVPFVALRSDCGVQVEPPSPTGSASDGLTSQTVVWHLTVRRMRRDQDYARLFQLHPVELESLEGDKTT